MDAPSAIVALLVALAVDRWLGEPPAAVHPVVWMGRYLHAIGERFAPAAALAATPAATPEASPAAVPVASPAESRPASLYPARPSTDEIGSFWWGALAWLGGAALFCLPVALLAAWLATLSPWWMGAVALGLLLKPMLAWRMLWREVAAVEAALALSLAQGRAQLSQLCSRDVSQLDAGQVRETALESLAENLNDSVVAPVFWFVLGGLPAAVLYRFANTADAMWGYRGPRGGRDWEWAGKWAARADDVLSWIPARIIGVLLMLVRVGLSPAESGSPGWPRLSREAARTPSPNSGWPIAALALVLGVRLGKPGVYLLNAQGRAPVHQDVRTAIALCGRTLAVGVGLAMLALWASRGGAG